jgi:hypothetical protein
MFTRRAFLASGAGMAGLVLLGCSGDDSTEVGASGTDTPDTGTGSGSDTSAAAPTASLLTLFPDDALRATGEQRLPLLVVDAEGVPLATPPASLPFTVTKDGGEPGTPIDVASFGEGLPRAYFPLRFTPDGPGTYVLGATYEGAPLEATVQIAATSPVPGVGDPMRPFDTPTATDPRGVDPICTETPPCTLHDTTLAEALAEGRPIAFLVSTPQFCQVAICGPVLDVMLGVQQEFPGVHFLHAEVFAQPESETPPSTVAPVVEEYALTYEPVLFVADAKGAIRARLDSIFDRVELRDALQLVTT